MKRGKRKLVGQVFWQLLPIYLFLVILASFNIFGKYTLHFEILALVIAVLCMFRVESIKKKKPLQSWLVFVGLFLILVTRLVPYYVDDTALGYDSSYYIATINQYSENNVEPWASNHSPPALFTLTNFFKSIGVSTHALVVYFFIFLQILLGLSIYVFSKTFFNENAGIVSLFLFSLSYAQYSVFQLLYFKNVLGLLLLLTALTLFGRKQYIVGTIVAIVLFGTHRPSFFLFGLIYLAYTVNIYLKKDRTL